MQAMLLVAVSNAFLACFANTCLKLSVDDWRFYVSAYALNTASFSLSMFIFEKLDMAIAQLTISSTATICSVLIGSTVFKESLSAQTLAAVIIVAIGIVTLHVPLGATSHAVLPSR